MGRGLIAYSYQQCSRNCHFDGYYISKWSTAVSFLDWGSLLLFPFSALL